MKTELHFLRSEFGNNKDIPAKYELEILKALSHYPELKDVHIRFSLALYASVPYGTKPGLSSCFKPKSKRHYTVSILELSGYPTSKALLKNLTEEMQISVIGHELAHVLQFHKCNPLSLIGTVAKFMFASKRKILERDADITAIRHGLGEGLLKHAIYIRSIPGYVEERPNIETDYLKPIEIDYYMQHPNELPAA